jgi:hypothetical protein
VLHAHCVVRVWNGVTYDVFTDDLDAFVIGGPIEISAEGRDQQREARIVKGDAWQPSILEYFDYDLGVGKPADAQEANRLKAIVHDKYLGQPSGTSYTWIISGPLAFYGGTPTGQTARVYANAASARCGAAIMLRFSYTLNDHTYTVLDSADGFWTRDDTPDPNYRSISCHRPKEVVVKSQITDTLANGPPTWTWSAPRI